MSATLFAQFYRRGALDTVTPRGAPFTALSAEGGEGINAIGYGKVSIPLYDNARRVGNEQVQPGDLCLVWSTAPYMSAKRPLLVACFIVETRQPKDDKVYEISGADLLGELLEFYAIAPIGAAAEVVIAAVSLGGTVINYPPPQDDGWEVLEAAYPARGYMLQEVSDPGRHRMFFSERTTIQETDTLRVEYPDGEVFTSTVTYVHERRYSVEFADPLPQQVTTSMKVDVWSTRLQVSDASALVEGSYVFYEPGSPPDNTAPRPTGNILVDRVAIGVGGEPDYIYTVDPITDYIDAGTPLTQFQYIAPTPTDVELLFFHSTSTLGSPQQWHVLRSPLATKGTAYAPSRESVWDVLLAIAEMSGYQFRKYFRGLDNALSLNPFQDWRRIEYFPAGSPVVAGEVSSLSTNVTMAVNHATILKPMQPEDVSSAVTTLFPFGGGAGSGSFDFRLASIGTILDEYDGKIGYGVINNQYYIYNRVLLNAGARLIDAVETFAHISPLDHMSFDSRKEAANQLLRAACEWLLLHDSPQVTYVVDVFTIGEPRPGDVVSINYSGNTPNTTSDISLVITEVVHRVEPDPGYRVTTLTLNKSGTKALSGPRIVARQLADLRRGFRQANIGARGDARISYDRMEFGQDATVDSKTGNLLMRSLLGNVTLRAEMGNVYLDGNIIDISGAVDTSGVIRSGTGFVLADTTRSNDWIVTSRTVRRIPRVAIDYKEPPG